MTAPNQADRKAAVRIVLDGVPFVAPQTDSPDCPSTADHQIYMMELAEAAALLPLFMPGALTGNLEHDALKVFSTILRSGKVYDLLAGVLVREGQQLKDAPPGFAQAPTMWDRDQVASTILFFKHMKGVDAQALRLVLSQLVLGFFTTGALSSRLSPTSSAALLTMVAGEGQGAGRKTGARRRSGNGRK